MGVFSTGLLFAVLSRAEELIFKFDNCAIDSTVMCSLVARAGSKPNVWTSTFSPGVNPNMKKTGASYYDKPSGPDKGSVWDAHLTAEAARNSFDHSSSPPEETKMSMKSLNERVQKAMQQASTGGGEVDYNAFVDLLRKGA